MLNGPSKMYSGTSAPGGVSVARGVETAYAVTGSVASTFQVRVSPPNLATSACEPGAIVRVDRRRFFALPPTVDPSSVQATGPSGCVVSTYTTSLRPTGLSVDVERVIAGVTATGSLTPSLIVHVSFW